MFSDKVQWSIPRLGVAWWLPCQLVPLAYAIIALVVASGIAVSSFARVLIGIVLLAGFASGLDAFGLRRRVPWLESPRRRVTAMEWAAIGVGVLLVIGCILVDFGGLLLVALVSVAGYTLVSDAWGLRSRIPVLNSPNRQTTRMGWAVAWLIGLTVLVAPTLSQEQPAAPAAARQADGRFAALVLRVIDGDTLEVRSGERQFRVRVLGTDTTELRRADCFAREGAVRTQDLTAGQIVLLKYDSHQKGPDRNGRDRAHVWLPGNTLLGLLLIREGFARVPDYRAPHNYEADYRSAQDIARTTRRGGWGACGW
jgi:micrococcal nuclease